MPKLVTIHPAETPFSELIAAVERGETIIMARGTQPVAELIPIAPKTKRTSGAMRGVISIGPEVFEPLPADELAAWER